MVVTLEVTPLEAFLFAKRMNMSSQGESVEVEKRTRTKRSKNLLAKMSKRTNRVCKIIGTGSRNIFF